VLLPLQCSQLVITLKACMSSQYCPACMYSYCVAEAAAAAAALQLLTLKASMSSQLQLHS
jgi:hypothetical protein